MKTKRKLLKTAVIIILLPIIFFGIFMIPNDIALYKFSKQLYNAPLPKNTQILEKHNICGRLYGTGDGMELWQ